MGFTHYWYLNEKANNVSAFVKTTAEMSRIIQSHQSIIAGQDGGGKPDLRPDTVIFNGQGDEDSYETFLFEPYGNRPSPSEEGKDFAFCKTACKPYDIVVVACLAVAAENLGAGIEVSSDGNRSDWVEGVALASRVLGRDVPNPIAEPSGN